VFVGGVTELEQRLLDDEAGPDPVVAGEPLRVHIDVDAAVLSGERPDRVCEIGGFGPVTRTLVQRLLCDCHVTLTADFPHASIDLGPRHRTIRLRLHDRRPRELTAPCALPALALAPA
jgi:hypothetical protein